MADGLAPGGSGSAAPVGGYLLEVSTQYVLPMHVVARTSRSTYSGTVARWVLRMMEGMVGRVEIRCMERIGGRRTALAGAPMGWWTRKVEDE